ERGLRLVQRGLVDAALFPQRRPMGLDGGRFKGFGEFAHGENGRSRAQNARRPMQKRDAPIVGSRAVLPWSARGHGAAGRSNPSASRVNLYINKCSPALSPPRIT